MNDYAIITNRKRAVIALIHSVVFLLIALRTLAVATAAMPIWLASASVVSSVAMLAIYLVVSSILMKLVQVSRCAREKLYFAFCASSATLGLLRTVFGDPSLHLAQYLRVAMLICAVVTGTSILRGHSRPAVRVLCGDGKMLPFPGDGEV
jgi:hypothetical protein